MARSRTNIVLDDDRVRIIQYRYGLRTKTEAVDMALRHLAGWPMELEEAQGMYGARALGDVPQDVGPRSS